MFKWILFALLSYNLFALEISIQGAKENFKNYSILHLKDNDKFVCQSIKNDFDVTTQIVCAFNHQPSSEIKNIENDFFKVDTKVKSGTFFLLINPVYKIKLYPMPFNLVKDDSVFDANIKLTNHWMIVGYKDKVPYMKNDPVSDVGINFPFFMNTEKLPYVGGLDMKGNPVHIKKVQDISDYIEIKQLFKEKKYEKCMSLIVEVTKSYPNSLFKSELLVYKIKVFAKLGDFDSVIDLSKNFLREYSSDENVAEILSLIAKGYSKIGLNTDADYFFDRLFSEHAESPFSKWGYIYKADMLDTSGASSKALKYYNMALDETQDLEIAATAAFKLANFYLDKSEKKKASEYVFKIIKAKSDFFHEHYNESMDMMNTFADEGDYESASAIAKALYDKMSPKEDDYEVLLKNRGLWLAQTANKQEALDVLNKYLNEFKDGSYEHQVQVAKDSLFFDTTDKNASTRLAEYDNLIEQYKNDTIGQRAIYEKAKLQLQNQMYSEVLANKESLLSLDETNYPDTKKVVYDAAIGLMKVSLSHKECKEVLNISNDYNISLSYEWDEDLYDCAMKGGDFTLSKDIAGKNLKTKDLNKRKEWLYRYIKVDFSTGNYSDAIGASKDLVTLIKDDKNSKYNDVYRLLFDSYQRLEDDTHMIEAMAMIEDVYGHDYKDIDRYVAMVAIGTDRKDDNMIIKYGSIVYDIQKRSNSYVQSPYIEFALYQAYINLENYNEAMNVIRSLDKVQLNKNQRARQKYLLGTVLEKLWKNDEANKAYQDSIDADPSSAWAKLAKDAKGI